MSRESELDKVIKDLIQDYRVRYFDDCGVEYEVVLEE